jgi:hypothetical protein
MTSSYNVPHIGEYPSQIKRRDITPTPYEWEGRGLAITYIDLRSP